METRQIFFSTSNSLAFSLLYLFMSDGLPVWKKKDSRGDAQTESESVK